MTTAIDTATAQATAPPRHQSAQPTHRQLLLPGINRPSYSTGISIGSHHLTRSAIPRTTKAPQETTTTKKTHKYSPKRPKNPNNCRNIFSAPPHSPEIPPLHHPTPNPQTYPKQQRHQNTTTTTKRPIKQHIFQHPSPIKKNDTPPTKPTKPEPPPPPTRTTAPHNPTNQSAKRKHPEPLPTKPRTGRYNYSPATNMRANRP